MSKYDFDGGNGGNDYDNNPNLKMEPPCKVRCELESVFVSSSDYGQSLGINIKNARLEDGILGRDENSGKLKVLSWAAESSIPKMTEDTSLDDLGDYAQRTYVGNNYTYEVQEARLEADPDVGYESDPAEPVEMGDFVLFFGSTENGPKSKSKTLAKILTEQGRDAVLDENSQFDWLDENVALRSDLMGKEVVLAMTTKESDESGRTFHHPYVLDGKTNAPIFVDNSASDDEPEEEEEEEEDDGNDVPADVQSFFDTCSELNITNKEAVSGLLKDMKSDDDIDPDQIDEFGGDEAVIEAVAN